MKTKSPTDIFALEFTRASLEVIRSALILKAKFDANIQPARLAKQIEQELNPEKFPADEEN